MSLRPHAPSHKAVSAIKVVFVVGRTFGISPWRNEVPRPSWDGELYRLTSVDCGEFRPRDAARRAAGESPEARASVASYAAARDGSGGGREGRARRFGGHALRGYRSIRRRVRA